MSKKKASSAGLLVSISLFMLFMLFLMLMLLTGTSSFKKVNAVIEERYTERTVMMYISQKLHRCAEAEILHDFAGYSGVTAIAITNYYDGIADTYYLYVRGGYLRELSLFGELDDSVDLSAGTEILPAEGVTFEQVKPNLIRVTKGTATELVYAGGVLTKPIETSATSAQPQLAEPAFGVPPDFAADEPTATAETTAETTAPTVTTSETTAVTTAVTTTTVTTAAHTTVDESEFSFNMLPDFVTTETTATAVTTAGTPTTAVQSPITEPAPTAFHNT